MADLRPGDEERLARSSSGGRRRAARSTSAGGVSDGRRRREAEPRRPRRCPISLDRRAEPSSKRPGRRPVPPGRRAGGGPPRRAARFSAPSLRWSSARNCERRTSSPPPAPNTAPISAADRDDVVPRPAAAAASPPCLYCALMPATYASMIRIASPALRALRAQQVELLREPRLRPQRSAGTSCPESANANGLMPGASSAAMRPGPRRSSMSSCRSAAVAQPAPKATSSAVRPLTCGTPHRSRVMVTPAARPLDADGAFAGAEAERLALEVAAQVGVRHAVARGGSAPRTARSGRSSSS